MYDPAHYNLSQEDIPDWMQPTYRGIDWSLLAVVLLCTVIAWPLSIRTGIPPSLHAENEMYRIIEVAESLEAGQVYPRWAPNFNYGYGSPIFNHIAPLPHYAGGVYVALIQEEPHVAMKAMLIGAIFTLGMASYGFMRRRFGELAGLWGTSVLLLSPYTLQTVPYLHTDVGLLWAMASLMLVLWSMDRALTLARGRDLLFLSSSVVLLLLSHTRMSPYFFGLAVLWGGVMFLIERPTAHWRLTLLGILGGIGLSAFYALPMVAEHSAYNWQYVRSYPLAYDSTSLFETPPLLDRSAFNHAPDLYLGLATWLWAGVGVFWLAFRGIALRQWRQGDWVAAVVFIPPAVLSIGLTQGQPTSTKSLLFPQPIEVLSIAVVSLSILAAQVGSVLESYIVVNLRRLIALSILLTILIISAIGSVHVPRFAPVQVPVTTNQHFQEEIRGNTLGTVLNGYMVPAAVQELPPPSDELSRDLLSLPPSTRITINSPVSTSYEIETSHAQPFTILNFDYPGWQVQLNDVVVDDLVSDDTGLITVTLNEGLNRLEVKFTDTTPRQVGWIITAMAFAIVLTITLWLERDNRSYTADPITPDEFKRKRQFQQLSILTVLVLSALLIIGRTFPETVTRNTPPDRIPSDINALDLLVAGVVQNGVSLLGYQIANTEMATDESILLELYWRPNGVRVDSYQIRFLFFKDGQVTDAPMYRHIAAFPVRRWPSDRYVSGSFEFPAPDTPGTYQIVLEIGVNACEQLQISPCDVMVLSEIYDLRGPIGQQILLPEPIVVYN